MHDARLSSVPAGAIAHGPSSPIEVEGLVKRYGSLTAVNGVSFTVNTGETFGLLGPNGAGKTTTLEMIEGLRKPDGGRIRIGGIDVSEEPRRARSIIGVQLQEAGFFDLLTVRETVRLFAKFHRKKVDADTLLERLQLQDKARSFVNTLSGGQKQRLSIALALVNDPEVVFLDEPTTGLDPQARHNLWDVIRSIQADGRTVVLTTHYMEEAEVLCDRVAIVDRGELIALDTPSRLIAQFAPGAKVYMTPVSDEVGAPVSDRLAALPGVHTVKVTDFGEIVLSTDTFERTIAALLDAVNSGEIAYNALRVETSNLEDVFLHLTGRRLRE